MTAWTNRTIGTPSGVSSTDADSWAPGWVDHEGRMRALRADLERYQPQASLRMVAAAARFDFAQLSRLEQGKSAWTLPTFARVAGGLLGTLSWYSGKSYPLHTIFPACQPRSRRSPASNHPEATPDHASCLPPIAPPDPPFAWHLDSILDRLNTTTAHTWNLKSLAERIADAEQMPEQAKTLHTILDRIQRFTDEPASTTSRRTSTGSIPTLLRLHRFLAPLLSTAACPLLLDDILTIHQWRIVPSA
ncbi:hypothetical protein K2Z83_09800 [Oscillochloris sp. ZM17-4]|uniref:hypothetical protein n=1 Tax=Oscillochloris sp. ZM17-4 TaxID=2866714 RepID=UPI001C73183D|nr:hypothetical protein [Oscillochloris sp. ZM17-4]MBX0327968.1 hypothetical protein [Oscillochloris sp. ZM17-4]